MSFYKNIKDIDCGKVNATSNVLLSYKKLRLFGAAFVLFVTSGMFGLSLSNLQIASEVRQVTQYWAFSPNNVGKLKYVNVEDEIMVQRKKMLQEKEKKRQEKEEKEKTDSQNQNKIQNKRQYLHKHFPFLQNSSKNTIIIDYTPLSYKFQE